ncbi:transcription termination factor Rho [Actinokineospora auranticolor]|uniref:Transcription termination factor Rho n=1 Tax=Actinokineospora auranticolor TaxID=155976 RepID=A0A2S6GHS9_9PSEU|nr:transcription termination factor Rho [Actinokineospora auranticolor]PPK64788.1 transcription termination factor Rho [Actinokineospora auranticolor]
MSNTDLLSSDAESQVPAEKAAGNGTTKRRAGLSGMVLAELRELAGQLGIASTTGMRKGDLIAAIKERQGGGSGGATAQQLPLNGTDAPAPTKARRTAAKAEQPAEVRPTEVAPAPPVAAEAAPESRAAEGGRESRRRRASRAAGSPEGAAPAAQPQATTAPTAPAEAERQPEARPARTDERPQGERGDRRRDRNDRGDRGDRQDRGDRNDRGDRQDRGDRNDRNNDRGDRGDRNNDRGDRQDRGDRNDRGDRGNRQDRHDRGDRNDRNDRQQDNRATGPDDDDEDGGGRRGRRFRDRRRRGGRVEGGGGGQNDTEVREDDVLLPVAGVLDVLENYAFVRTSGYLAGSNDVYVSLSLVRKHGLRRGDAITGLVRQPREGEQQRQKFNPLVRVESVNGLEPDQARNRPEFTKLTPLYPNERLRLETEPHILTTRVIDLVMPVGKGQRALIVSPPKAGKTSVLQAIANAITTNNPEIYLMVVLIDERPEEVTDMQRSVKGEVIASTFDRPPGDHTSVAELSIERAKRLVEMGHDVVVLLDSITRLGRAYNLAAPASGRILSGGVDSTALFPPKRFLGAARNIEGGGSLTIFATALVETGSAGDTVIFEEFKGTGNAELKLDRKIADKRIFPAVDVDPSSTRKEELLLSPDELAVTVKLRRVLHALDSQAAIELLLDRLRKSRTNIEFLMQVAKTTPQGNDD